MSIIFDQLTYVLGIQKRSGGKKLVLYSEEHNQIIFSGNPIWVEMIREILETTLYWAKKLLTNYLFISEDFEETLISIIPTLHDDTTCAQNGASLVSQNPKAVQLLQQQIIEWFLQATYSQNSTHGNGKIFIHEMEKVSPLACLRFEES
ncbi:hypothetical protein L873DRAFT_1854325 [Choiromyces venosus 120613-1]|uniref:Uncharacterized protein n=1 Tax=Choiromyces venosus 120613-1 TaxID=1336337 RepID=A0A3N4J8D2_9PEZI|nr:hypothetical protein L873DRAFT_1854325 [Choiromyces venosus 120613-1]